MTFQKKFHIDNKLAKLFAVIGLLTIVPLGGCSFSLDRMFHEIASWFKTDSSKQVQIATAPQSFRAEPQVTTHCRREGQRLMLSSAMCYQMGGAMVIGAVLETTELHPKAAPRGGVSESNLSGNNRQKNREFTGQSTVMQKEYPPFVPVPQKVAKQIRKQPKSLEKQLVGEAVDLIVPPFAQISDQTIQQKVESVHVDKGGRSKETVSELVVSVDRLPLARHSLTPPVLTEDPKSQFKLEHATDETDQFAFSHLPDVDSTQSFGQNVTLPALPMLPDLSQAAEKTEIRSDPIRIAQLNHRSQGGPISLIGSQTTSKITTGHVKTTRPTLTRGAGIVPRL